MWSTICTTFTIQDRAQHLRNRLDAHLLSPECLVQFETQVRNCFEAKAELSTSDFKELTGLSRKYLIPLLEWLDASNVTSRKGNNRILRSHKAHDNG